MQRLVFVVIAIAAFGATPVADKVGIVPGAALLLGLSVLLGMAASGMFSLLAAASGALGALAAAALSSTSAAAAGAALVAFAFAERTSRVRTRRMQLLHVALTLTAGAVSGAVTHAYLSASLAVYGVSLVVAAVLIALPLLIEADDPVAHTLDMAADDVSEPAKSALRQGAELRRTAEETLLDKKAIAEVRNTWSSLLRLADARVRLERSHHAADPSKGESKRNPTTRTSSQTVVVLKRVDDRIAEHVAALGRALAAVDAASAAKVSLDDTALRNVENVGESLDEVSKAIVEVDGHPSKVENESAVKDGDNQQTTNPNKLAVKEDDSQQSVKATDNHPSKTEANTIANEASVAAN